MKTPDPLVRDLMPVLIHKLGNTTQLLTGLNAMLGIDGGEEIFVERTDDLGRASSDVHRLGYALAVLGSAGGSNLLLARRDPRGLEILLELVHASLRRNGRSLSCPAIPDLAPSALAGWQLPWALASLVHARGLGAAEGESVTFGLGRTDEAWIFGVGECEETSAATDRILAHLPGAEIGREGGEILLHLPTGWLVEPTG